MELEARYYVMKAFVFIYRKFEPLYQNVYITITATEWVRGSGESFSSYFLLQVFLFF